MKTKYPIILVHGIMIKDIFFLKAFGQIDRILKIQGHNVSKSNIDGVGTIESNAAMLKEEILKICEEFGVDKVNIIAHSKGGLDSKYMIQNLDMEDKVASLTTLCTPHKGSPMASWFLKWPKFALKFLAFWINFWYRIFGDKNPDSLKVCQELALVDTIEDETISFSDKVYCQSYSTTLKRSRDNFLMGIPLMFAKHYEKEKTSDGLVSKDSSKFGDYHGDAIDDSISHSDIIDLLANKKKKDRIYHFYSLLCEDLYNRGF